MLYTMKQLVNKFHKSKATIRICLSRYGILKILKDKIAFYDISKENIKKIKYFLKYRKDCEDNYLKKFINNNINSINNEFYK